MIKWILISGMCGIIFALIDNFIKRKRYKKFKQTSNGLHKSLRIATKNLIFKDKKVMDEYGGKLLEWYMKGFNDELKGSTSTDQEDRLLKCAYSIGAMDAIIGDDIPSYDMVAPNLTGVWNEAAKMHKEGEISEMQLRKIFRILSGLRNDGEINLTN